MKKVCTYVFVSFFAVSPVWAQADVSVKSEETAVINLSDVIEEEADFDTEAEVKAEVGEGEQSEETSENEREMIKEEESPSANLEMSATASAGVSIRAVEVRGWNPGQKAEFLTTVKSAVEVRTDTELENFAQGVILEDEHIVATKSGNGKVEVQYDIPARFFGIFSARIPARATVTFGEEVRDARVKVKFPWYRVFYNVTNAFDKASLESEIQSEIQTQLQAEGNLKTTGVSAQIQAQTMQAISNVMKASVN